MNNKNYYGHIDGLRALAIVSVFLCNLDFPLFRGGFVGVDVFFVISGFLITNIINQQLNSSSGFSFLNFFERRVRRIVPALFFTLFICFVAGVALLNAASFKTFGISMEYAALSISNIFFKNQAGYFDALSQSSPLLHTWALGVTEQFYIFCPVILFFGYKIFKKNIVIPIILLFIISLLSNLMNQQSNPIAPFYLAQCRVFEFCIGAFIVFLIKYEKMLHCSLKEVLCSLGIILILTPIFTYNSNTLFPSFNALAPCIGAALIIFSGTAKYSGFIFSSKPVRFLGLISYSLYLIHWPLIVFFKTYHQDYGFKFEISFNEKILVIVLALLCSYFMYYFIEQPFRKKRSIQKNRINTLKPIAQGLSLALVIAYLGTLIGQSHGWIWRFNAPDEFAKVEDINKYHNENWGGAGYSGEFIHKGKTSHAQIVVLGDAHAAMLDEGIVKEIAIPNQLSVFTASGGGAGKYMSTLSLPGITRIYSDQKLADDSARHAYTEALKMVHKTKEQSILIISAAWAAQIYASGNLKDHRPFNINPYLMDSYNDYKPLTTALDKLLKLMGSKKLVIIGNVPGSQYNPQICLDTLKWFKHSKCSWTDDVNRNKAALNINKILALYASKNKNVYFLNPYDILCEKGRCESTDRYGRPYYTDGRHLSKIGSIYLVSYLKYKILGILNPPKKALAFCPFPTSDQYCRIAQG